MPRSALLAIAGLALGLGAGCNRFPELDAQISEGDRDAAYIELVPSEEITGMVPPPAVTPDTASALDARGAALRARAERLKQAGIDEDTRRRMSEGVTQ